MVGLGIEILQRIKQTQENLEMFLVQFLLPLRCHFFGHIHEARGFKEKNQKFYFNCANFDRNGNLRETTITYIFEKTTRLTYIYRILQI
jgi:hypothetical protein